MEKYKAKLAELVWWSVKWVLAASIFAGILIVAVQVHARWSRHNLLVDAILNNLRQVEIARYEQKMMREKAVQELPGPDDPVPTEDRKR